MGLCLKLAVILPALLLGYFYMKCSEVPELPKLDDTWWGPGKPSKEDTSIKPFQIKVSDEVLKDLKHRLDIARDFVPPLEGTQQQYGMNTNLLKNIVTYWKTKYNWKDRETFLNKFPQFTTSIQGLNIHFIHVKPKQTQGVKVLPLLLLHGWPGSVREFYDLIPLLTTPRKGYNYVFEVVVPSLPGYGFSQGASKPGLGAIEMAVVFKNLMNRLGYEKYYLQGGDWGAIIVQNMATLYPDIILGVHSNMCFSNTPKANLKWILGSLYPSFIVDEKHVDKMYPVSKVFCNIMLEMGYMHLQATKPDTIGAGLNDSPVALGAYILEKFTTWTNPSWKELADGGLTKKFTYDDLLDNVMIYWVTGSITTSMRLYSESFNKKQLALQSVLDKIPLTVPTACARFANELAYQSDSILTLKYKNLIQSTDFDDGGHFAAFELPAVMADDIYLAVTKFRKASDETVKKEL